MVHLEVTYVQAYQEYRSSSAGLEIAEAPPLMKSRGHQASLGDPGA
jgi:hypothetical protein